MTAATVDRPIELSPEDDDSLYEIIDGLRVEKSMGIRQILLANRLAIFINQMAFAPRLGIAVIEALFDLGIPGAPEYRPHMAFVSEGRWPRDRSVPSTNAWAVVPDLAVEVVSPSNTADEVQAKVDIYLKAGVRLVWVVYLKSACVHVHDGSSTIRIVRPGGELEGEAILPGFRLPLESLFANKDEPA
jgi:Uma2 family endonuclease